MGMHNPPHPGGIVKRECLDLLGLTVTRATEGLGVTRQALSELTNERTGVSVEMAIRLSKALRLDAGDLAGDADGLRSMAGPRPRRSDRGGEIRSGVTGAFHDEMQDPAGSGPARRKLPLNGWRGTCRAGATQWPGVASAEALASPGARDVPTSN